ncbi:AAA-like domain-containing protein [Mesorhizobium loti]|nr:AAA-like domain-containing protein [Mesorhizobium loti]
MASPGIHPSFEYDVYGGEEQQIIRRFASEWYITSGTRPLILSEKSNYRAFLGKPCDPAARMFNLEREVVAVFSNYEEFEVRTIDAFEVAASRFNQLRIDPICRVLISRDRNIVERIKDVLKSDPELPIIIPFTYYELINNRDKSLIINRFRQHFFSRDLFAFESPLKRDTYFFGRTDLINSILSRHRSNENSALFGLRRSGKTSIIFGLERASRLNGQTFVSIDCQNPSVHQRRWFQLLPYILRQTTIKYSLKHNLIDESKYTELNASDQFFDDIKTLFLALKRSPIIVAFDEVERISPKTGSSPHWSSGTDFILFWQAIRSAFQRHTGVFSFSLIGTNSQCIESAFIEGHDNPIFNGVPIEYIPGFDHSQTSEMVKKLGLYMGLQFNDVVCSKLHDDFGGHPYLVRHICSIINRNANMARPVEVDKSMYDKAKLDFEVNYANYTEMILDVLIRDFPDEYVMLNSLANDDIDLFNSFAQDTSLTSHLIGYGLIAKGRDGYFFRIESVRDHLRKKSKYVRLVKTNEERMVEVAARRATIEPAIRRLILAMFTASFGKKAQQEAISILSGQSLKRVTDRGFSGALQPNSIDLNLSDLAKMIIAKWSVFENLFSITKNEFEFYLEAIRVVRTNEAHSGQITNDQFVQARIAFSKIEDELRSTGFLSA